MASAPSFDDFQPATKSEWLAKITNDLKGKPLEDLNWNLDENLTIEAVFHLEDQQVARPPIDMNKSTDNDWEIGVALPASYPAAANKVALAALTGGVESLLLELDSSLELSQLSTLLEGINLPYISVQFAGLEGPTAGRALLNALQEQSTFAPTIKGGLYLAPEQGTPEHWHSLLHHATNHASNFCVCTVDGRSEFAGTAHIAENLSALLVRAHSFLGEQTEIGTEAEQVARHMQFAVSIGTSFFVEIAKLRALRLLWANVLDAYGVNVPMQLDVHPVMPAGETDPHTNMIRASTESLAAAIGGCNRLYLPPATQNTSAAAADSHYRIARNVQHILKMESFLDRVVDPSAGSYYIEALTERFAEQAWAKFQEQT